MVYLILFGLLILASLVFVYPKWGSFLVWPILFTYPHYWWSKHQFLPLNIGMDDLFCVSLFFLIVFRRNFMEGLRVRFGYAFWIVTGFVFVSAIANGVGALDARGLDRTLFIKDIMKLGIYWGLFYAILHCIDSKRDLRIQLTMFSLASAAGGMILILQHFLPGPMVHWTSTNVLENTAVAGTGRATGAFLNANSAGCVLACAVILVTATIRLQRTRNAKLLTYSIVAVLLLATLLARSRSGLLALGGAFFSMTLFGRYKRLALMIVLAGVAIVVSFPFVRGQLEERIAQTYNARSGELGRNVQGRFATWMSYFETASLSDYLLGQGFRHGRLKNKTESHSAYVSLITVYGLGGVVWAAALFAVFRRKARQARMSGDPLLETVSSGCLFALIAWSIYALAADAVSAQYPRYILFYLIVLIDRAAYLARREPSSAPSAPSAETAPLPCGIQPA